ncbi:MAG: DUF2070 family protein, partial [Candidatus Geothermarchaeota archaeon]
MSQEIAIFRNFYRKLFSLGTFKVNLVRFLILYAIYVLLLLFVSKLQPSLSRYLNGLLLLPFILILHDSLISQLNKRDQHILIARRILSLNVISICLLILGVIYALPSTMNNEAILLSFSFTVNFLTLFRTIVLYSILERCVLAAVSTNVTTLAWCISMSLFSLMEMRQLSLIALLLSIEPVLVSITASVVFLLILSVTTKINGRYNTFDYLRAYLDSWLLHNPSSLEKLLSKDSSEVKVSLNALIFPETYRGPSILLFPGLHFGPFGNMGSSRYPSVASKYFHQKNIKSASFHTPSTHELDAINN